MNSAHSPRIVELTDDTFDRFLHNYDAVVVAFYLKWVPRYKRFTLAYEEAAALATDTGVPFVQVNCETERAINKHFKYTNWPSISILRGPEKIQDLRDLTYSGPLRGTNLSCWVRRQVAPIVTLLDAESFLNFKDASEVTVIGFFLEDDHVSRDCFLKVAITLKSRYLFGIIHDEVVTRAEQVKVPGIVLYKNFDERKNTFDFITDMDRITKFIQSAVKPLVEEFVSETHQKWLNGNMPLGYVFIDGTESASFMSEVINPLARLFSGRIQFGTVQLPGLDYIAEETHTDIQNVPAFAIRDPVGMRSYPLKQPPTLSKEILQAFVQDFLDGKLKPAIKSAPVPKTQGPVLELVADTWDELVINNDKDVFIEYYTQACGPCKALLPAYTRLAEMYATRPESRDKVVLAKIDAEENDVDLNIRGFPTFKLFPVGAKDSPIICYEDRTVKDWAQFIFENGGNKVRIPDGLLISDMG